MARKQSVRKKKAAAPKARAPKLRRIVVIDDEIGADPAHRPTNAYNQHNFLGDVGARNAEWIFSDAHDSFLDDFVTESAAAFVENLTSVDLFLVDLMFGKRRMLGLNIIAMIQMSKHSNVKVALMTTHGPSDPIVFERERSTLGVWLEQHGVRLISKDMIFAPDEFWRAIDEVLASKVVAGAKKTVRSGAGE